MIEKLRLLFDLLDLQWNEAYVPAAQWIVDHPHTKILSSHPYGFVFQEFVKYVAGDVSEEVFLALGDITSPQVLSWTSEINPEVFLRSIVFGVETDIQSYANTFMLIEKVPWLVLDSQLNVQLSVVWSYLFSA